MIHVGVIEADEINTDYRGSIQRKGSAHLCGWLYLMAR